MRLSVSRATTSAQLLIDLTKLYQGYFTEQQLNHGQLTDLIEDPEKMLFVTIFNARHLGAVQVTIKDNKAILTLLCVREITRRRGVALNLLREVEKVLVTQQIQLVEMDLLSFEEAQRDTVTHFMKAVGYQLKDNNFSKQL